MPEMMVLTNDEGQIGLGAAIAALARGHTGLDAIEAGIRVVEADPAVRSVGRGGAPNILGQMECDASIMDGATLRAGAVGALQGYLHAISVARQVMEQLPHVMLVGDGAARFAREIGAAEAEMLTPQAHQDYYAWLRQHLPPEVRENLAAAPLAPYTWPEAAAQNIARGTTTWLAIDAQGNLAGGVSTSGWAYKYPGRLGDSPIIGAGLYVDNRYGGCACTHTGEMADPRGHSASRSGRHEIRGDRGAGLSRGAARPGSPARRLSGCSGYPCHRSPGAPLCGLCSLAGGSAD